MRRDRALATIVLSVDPTLLYLLGPDPQNPVVVWKKLADQFQKKTLANKLALRRKLYNLKLKDGQSMQKHVKMLTEIFDKLSIIGDPLDEENQVVHLLASLPESYDILVTALESSPEVPKLQIVTERLLHEHVDFVVLVSLLIIVNFEHISHLFLKFLLEQVEVSWDQ